MLGNVSYSMERELILVEATAVEDKLQKGYKKGSLYHYLWSIYILMLSYNSVFPSFVFFLAKK